MKPGCEIPLSTGGTTIVSPEDAGAVSAFRWRECSGYAARFTRAGGRPHCILLHRLIVERMTGAAIPAGLVTDHVNRDPMDNRRDNLRLVTTAQNLQNTTKPRPTAKVGVRHVRLQPNGKFGVQMTIAGKRIWGGSHATLEDAAAAAREMRQRMMTHCPENSATP